MRAARRRRWRATPRPAPRGGVDASTSCRYASALLRFASRSCPSSGRLVIVAFPGRASPRTGPKPKRRDSNMSHLPGKTPKRDTSRRTLRGRGGETRARAPSPRARIRASFAPCAFGVPVATNRDACRFRSSTDQPTVHHRRSPNSTVRVPEAERDRGARRPDERALPVPSSASWVTPESVSHHVASARAPRLPRRRTRWHDSVRAREPRRAPKRRSAAARGRRRAGVRPSAPRSDAARADGHAVRGRAGAEDGHAEPPRPNAVGRTARPRAARHRGASARAGPQEAGQRLPARRARFFPGRRECRRRRRPDRRERCVVVSARVH